MNQTSDSKVSDSLPPCEVTNSTHLVDDFSNGTYIIYNGSNPCIPSHASPRSHTRVKTYHMQPPLFDDSLAFYSKYDPATGIRTAAILGSCLFIVVVWGLYKAKCKKTEWTSQDRLFVEHYKKRFNGRKGRRGTDFAFMREPFRNRSGETSVAMEQTAKWIQSQPLQSNTVTRNNFKSTMGNLCLESFKATMYPVCDTNNINSQVPNGKVIKDKEPEKTTNDVDVQKLNERNLKLDLQCTYKDMLPFKQNLWKCRSFDDKVNMRNLSNLSSLDDIHLRLYPSDRTRNDLCDKSDKDSCNSLKINIGDDNTQDLITSKSQTSISNESILQRSYNESSQIVNLQTASVPQESVPSKDCPAQSKTQSSNGFPMLQPLIPTSLSSTIPPVLSHPQFEEIPLIDIDPSFSDNKSIQNKSSDSLGVDLAAFHIGSPSSCSSLDNDECFSLTAASSLTPPRPSSAYNSLTLIPPLPPYIPPVSSTNISTPNSQSDKALSTMSTANTTSTTSATSLNSFLS